VVLRGEAPGVKEGGVLKQSLHDVRIRARVSALPERIECNINHLALLGVVKVSDLTPPEGVEIITDPEQIVVQVAPPTEVVEEAAPAEGAEPELIGRKPAEEGEEEEK
jgi:large subunit ribosomal protein L25